MNKCADLHIHTNYSDSTSPPEEVVNQAHEYKIDCIAISDHDTIDGIAPAKAAAEQYGIEIIPGIELSTEIDGKDIHVLGYLFDYDNPIVKEKLSTIQDARIDRMRSMIEKLKEVGIDNIELSEVCALTQSKAVGRPHLAKILLEKGWVKSMQEAFNQYLIEGKTAYMPKYKMSPFEAIQLMRDFGGVTVLAHPMSTRVDELIPQLAEAGLNGLEAIYPNCSQKVTNHYMDLAKKHNLLVTGGSDAHGKAKKNTFLGKVKIPYELVEKLKEAAQQ